MVIQLHSICHDTLAQGTDKASVSSTLAAVQRLITSDCGDTLLEQTFGSGTGRAKSSGTAIQYFALVCNCVHSVLRFRDIFRL